MRMSSANQLVGMKYAYTNIWSFISKIIFLFGILNQSSVKTEIQSGMFIARSFRSRNWAHLRTPQDSHHLFSVSLPPPPPSPSHSGQCLTLKLWTGLIAVDVNVSSQNNCPIYFRGKFNTKIKNFFLLFPKLLDFSTSSHNTYQKEKQNDDNQKEKQIC